MKSLWLARRIRARNFTRELAAKMLEKIGLSESDLRCGAHLAVS